MKQCSECGSYHLEYEGGGTDEYGEYEEYRCDECGELTIFSIQ